MKITFLVKRNLKFWVVSVAFERNNRLSEKLKLEMGLGKCTENSSIQHFIIWEYSVSASEQFKYLMLDQLHIKTDFPGGLSNCLVSSYYFASLHDCCLGAAIP